MIITGNTYPVRAELAKLGGKWKADVKGWDVPDDKAEQAKALVAGAPAGEKRKFQWSRCKQCGAAPSRYNRIYGNGICRDCYKSDREEAEMGY